MENRLKELHHGLALDRTSCHRFLANQFRVLLTVDRGHPVPDPAGSGAGDGLWPTRRSARCASG